MNFGNLLDNACNDSGMSKAEIAQREGITRRALHYYLRGDRKPSHEIADRILRLEESG